MTEAERILRLAAARLHEAGVSWAVIGGLAVSVRGEPRFTRDADIVVAVTGDAEAEQLVARLMRAGFQIVAQLEQTATGRMAMVQLAVEPRTDAAPVVDLLFASSGIEPEIVAAADALEVFPGYRVPVAQTGHLIALKVLSRDDDTRPQDAVDLRALLLAATPDDIEMARAALDLIAERGYARGKDLQADLDVLIARFRPSE